MYRMHQRLRNTRYDNGSRAQDERFVPILQRRRLFGNERIRILFPLCECGIGNVQLSNLWRSNCSGENDADSLPHPGNVYILLDRRCLPCKNGFASDISRCKWSGVVDRLQARRS